MPELPEVESVRRQLDPELAGRTVVDVWWDPHPGLRRQFHRVELLPGRRIARVGRRGKFLISPLDRGLELVMHLGMTGSFRFDVDDEYARARLWLEDGRRLVFRDVRRFGRLAVVDAGDYAAIPTLATLGPEPLSDEFTPGRFAADLARTKAPVKPYLLTQRPVAGVGNIYADEALWLARVHPLRPAGELTPAEVAELRRGIRKALRRGLARQGATLRDYRDPGGNSGRMQHEFHVYGRTGESCDRCGTPIEKTRVAGRGTWFCPSCQPG
jgi:formamidopyrimidine-DNA glycosylase